MDMLRCYNSLYLRRKYELNKNKKNDNTVCRVRSSKYPGFPYSPLYYDSVNAMENNIEKCRDFRYILETYSDIHENNSIVFSSIYMSSSLIGDNNKLDPKELSYYRYEFDRLEKYILSFDDRDNNNYNNREVSIYCRDNREEEYKPVIVQDICINYKRQRKNKKKNKKEG